MIFFLTEKQIMKLHKYVIDRYGGIEGIRDRELLVSALAQPSITFEGKHVHKSFYEMGAAYLFHIACNHSFIDGNKRTGIVAAIVFLSLHEIELNCSEDEMYDFVMKVAQGKSPKKEIAKWLEVHSKS